LAAVRRGIACIAALAVLLLAACGGSGGGTTTTQLSPAAYRAAIAKVKTEAAKAQTDVGKGLQAKTPDELKQRIDEFAAATQRIGDEVAALKPPANAISANTELAEGLHDIAAGTRAASAKIAQLKTAKAGIAYLRHIKGPAKGAREVGSALAELQRLGYASAR
jgi:predicted transcriptional regulator